MWGDCLGWIGGYGNGYVGSPDLTHELVKTWDLIWMGTWQHSSISLNGFYNRYDQPIIAGLSGSTRTYIDGESEDSNGIN